MMPALPPGSTHPLDPASRSDLTLAEAFAAAVHENLRRMEEARTRLGDAQDLEGIHDLRTGARRLRAAVQLLADHLPKTRRRALGRGLRRLMAALAPARDLDVLRQAVAGNPLLEAAEAGRLHAALDRRLARAVQRVHAFLAGPAYGQLRDDLHVAADAVAAGGPPVRLAGPERILRAVATVLQAQPTGWEDAPDEGLHELRKQVKGLRYCLEAFAGQYGRPLARLIARCRELQEALGAIQDAAAFALLLRGCRTFGAGQFLACARLHAAEVRQRLAAVWRRAFAGRALARLGAHLLRRAARRPAAPALDPQVEPVTHLPPTPTHLARVTPVVPGPTCLPQPLGVAT